MKLTVTKPSDMTIADRAAFIDFVNHAGEVDPETLPGLVDQAIALITLHEDERLIGTAALKQPTVDYRKRTFRNAGQEQAETAYPLELGWVHVHQKHERKGHGLRLVVAALEAAKGDGVYATTKNDAMRAMLAKKLGFAKAGDDYPSKRKPEEMLSLYTRGATT